MLAMPKGLAGCVGILIFLHAGSPHADESVLVRDNSIAALINQLGEDVSSDVITRNKLRTLLAQEQVSSTAATRDELQEGIWSGVIERVYVDHMDEQGNLIPGPTQYYLHTNTEHLQVHFLDEVEAHAATGKHLAIRGYLVGRKALILDAARNSQERDRPGKDQRSRMP